MSGQIEVGSEAYKEIMRQAYGEYFLKIVDILGRKDFYGVVAEEGVKYCADRMGLSQESHVVEACSGIGGPARFMARTYGCRVTGIDINEFSVQVAEERTRKAGLDNKIDFRCGNALELPFPDESFTHAFGCDAWSYFPDKASFYKSIRRVLKPGGTIAFLDLAQSAEKTQKSHWEEIWGSYHPETRESYTSLLEAAGFQEIRHYDTTELAIRESVVLMNRLIKERGKILEAVGAEGYYATLETWSEILAEIELKQVSHYCFVARKP